MIEIDTVIVSAIFCCSKGQNGKVDSRMCAREFGASGSGQCCCCGAELCARECMRVWLIVLGDSISQFRMVNRRRVDLKGPRIALHVHQLIIREMRCRTRYLE